MANLRFLHLVLTVFLLSIGANAFSINRIENRAADTSCAKTPNTSNPDDDSNNKNVKINYSTKTGETCTAEQKGEIETEFRNAIAMVNSAKADWSMNGYEDIFFAKKAQQMPKYKETVHDTLTRITEMLDGTVAVKDYTLTVTCAGKAKSCAKFVAFMKQVDKNHGTLNVCDHFFDKNIDRKQARYVETTQNRLDQCENGSLDLRDAQRSRAGVLVHESIHTSYAMGGPDPGEDIAYGLDAARLLALGTFDRRCGNGPAMRALTGNKPLCGNTPQDPKTEDGLCKPELCMQNPDSWSFVASGIWFSEQCKKKIQLPQEDGGKTNVGISAKGKPNDNSAESHCKGYSTGIADFPFD